MTAKNKKTSTNKHLAVCAPALAVFQIEATGQAAISKAAAPAKLNIVAKTGTPGSIASVLTFKKKNAWFYELSIPAGTAGLQGPKGDPGAAGPKGDPGSTGATGAKGDTGAAATLTANDLITAVGVGALSSNTTGSSNTAYGNSALQLNTEGLRNTASGESALYSNTTGFNNTASGYYALFTNSTGYHNTASGNSALQYSTTGTDNTGSGSYALYSNTTGGQNTAIGSGADALTGNLSNATAIGYDATVNASNKVRIGNTEVTVLECQVALTQVSDPNQKENFQPVGGAAVLEKIRSFNLTSWNLKQQDPKIFRHYGPMAQDFYAAFGKDAVGEIGTPTTINSGDMAGIMMTAIKELSTENIRIKDANAEMRKENAAMKAQLATQAAAMKQQTATDKALGARLARLEQFTQPGPQISFITAALKKAD